VLTTLQKPTGTTPAEQYLQHLCKRTFLSLWSHPCLFRDQGNGAKGDGKELCDLLVVFRDTIIVFSDKNCRFPCTDDVQQDWGRWSRRAILESAKQAWGAERWIRQYPQRIFLNRACTEKFPFPLPAEPKVHLIVVAHDVADRCRKEVGGSGSLRFDNDLKGLSAHTSPDAPPFVIGDINPGKTFVHVLDDNSLEIVLDMVNTISDFVDYFARKERFLRSRTVASPGEEEFLAYYLMHMDPKEDCHDFVITPGSGRIEMAEGQWESFSTHPSRLAQIEADTISYAWDLLIEKFSRHAMEGSQQFPSATALVDAERIMRFMASESRVRRRLLAKGLIEALRTTASHQQRMRLCLPSSAEEPLYVFLLYPRDDNEYERYRERRAFLLRSYCQVAKLKYPHVLDIVGIATETDDGRPGKSEDAMYLDVRTWTEENEAEALYLQQELSILQETTESHAEEFEFPTAPRHPYPVWGSDRDRPCPCGSGLKWKKCHGDPRHH
jgi:SEC-C motif